ncbi:hypothetical protein [Dankookia sp. P2]|uniref:hypothetical protein n=1 Tax=Dankookia sp. P2 TaxID=3423955 RepID=UPI003D67E10B
MEARLFSPFAIAAMLLVLAAGFAWLNHRVFHLPSSIGPPAMSLRCPAGWSRWRAASRC